MAPKPQLRIEGITHPCYVAEAIVAQQDPAGLDILRTETLPGKGDEPGPERAYMNGLPGTVVEAAQSHLEDNPCTYVTDGRCPLVSFLVEQVNVQQ